MIRPLRSHLCRTLVLATALLAGALGNANAQDVRTGAPVSPAHRAMYERGLAFLVKQQQPNGSFDGDAGVTGICVMALLASGEDPNHGRYAKAVRRGVKALIAQQNARTGQLGTGMYQHGFALLCLADCYGAVDQRLLGEEFPRLERTLGEALTLGVECAVTSQQQNPFEAWRYSPRTREADTSVSGAVLMGLLGARNAGVAVPDAAIDGALRYFSKMTSAEGDVGYSGIGSFAASEARTAIVTTVFAVAKRREAAAFLAARRRTLEHISGGGHGSDSSHPCYRRYYVSQALFQTDHAAWRAWSTENTRDLMGRQAEDGSLRMDGTFRQGCYPTGMLLLSAALDFTFLPIYER